MSQSTVPTQIANRYELKEILGRGGMGAVYRAYDRLEQKFVAIKQVLASPSSLIPNSQKSSTEPSIALAREFQILARLRHPNIVSVYDYGFDEEKRPYISMQLLEDANSLAEAAQDADLEGKLDLLGQVLRALGYLHHRGILHRDLKPGNVLVVNGQVKVLDFGLATGQKDILDSDSNLVGTLAYMAPELLQGHRASQASDLYAFGVMVYQVFTGMHPFNREKLSDLLQAILDTQPDVGPLESLSSDVQPMMQFDEDDTQMLPATLARQGVKTEPTPSRGHNPLAELVLMLLEKSPDLRPRDPRVVMYQLYTSFEKDVPKETVEVRESFLKTAAFVGRESEMDQLNDGIDQALVSQGTLWLIGGESGVGKSRIMEELRVQGKVAGMDVLRGQGVEGGGLPFQLWRELMTHKILNTELSDIEASVIKEVVPNIASLLERDVPDAPDLDGSANIERLVQTIVDIVKRQEEPTLLLLEDLQWTSESLLPIKRLADDLHNMSLMIVGTYRDDESPDLPKDLPTGHIIHLERLTESEMIQLSTAMLGEIGRRPEVIDLLSRETEGNTFFMVEAVRMLAEEAGSLEEVGQVKLPTAILTGGMQEILRRRIATVPADFQSMLHVAAVAGREIDEDILGACDPDLSLEDFFLVCETAAVLSLVEGTWQFAHAKLRETILAELEIDEIPELNRQVAEAIEAVYTDDWEYNERLLEHWYVAGNLEKHLHYLNAVVERLINIAAAYETAHRLLERGLADLGTDDPRRVTLLNWAARACWKRGDYDIAERIASDVTNLADIYDNPTEMANSLNLLGLVAWEQGQYDAAQDWHERSLALREKLEDQPGIAASLSNLGNVMNAQGDPQASIQFYERSFSIQEALGNQWGSASTLNNIGVVNALQGDFDTARDYFERSHTIRETLGDQNGIAMSFNNLGLIAYLGGHYDQAEDYYVRSLRIREHIGDKWGVARSLANVGMLQVQLGEEYAGATLVRGLRQAHELGMIPLVLEFVGGLAQLLSKREDFIRSARLCGLVRNHPAYHQEVKQIVENIIPMLETNLTEATLQKALDDGAKQELDIVVANLIKEFEEAF